MHVVECAAAETRDQAPSRTTAMFAWDPYAAFFLGGGDDVCAMAHAISRVGGVEVCRRAHAGRSQAVCAV